MKTKVARRIVASAEAGDIAPSLHTLRKAALALGRPIQLKTEVGDLVYYPKEIRGEFARVCTYRPRYHCTIVPNKADLKATYDYVRPLEEKPGTIVMDIHAGSGVAESCRVAHEYADAWKAKVVFDFNGIVISARPFRNYWETKRGWEKEILREQAEYIASDEYKELQARRAVEVEEKQKMVDELISSLPNVILDEARLMDWIYNLTEVADDCGVKFDKEELSSTLKAAGWVVNAHVFSEEGLEPVEIALKRLELRTSPASMAEYIVGQVISCLDSGMPPHPITRKFVSEYRGDIVPEPPIMPFLDDEAAA